MRIIPAVLLLALAACSPPSRPVADNATHRAAVAARAQDVAPLRVGDRVPPVTLGSTEGTPVELAALYADAPVMLVFYRGSWCPYCTAHLAEVAQQEAALRAAGVRVVAVSPDSPETLAAHQAENPDLTYTMLSDADASAATAFGLAFRVDDDTVETYRGYGIDLQRASGHDHRILPVPAVYLIDAGGVIRYAHWDADYTQRASGAELLAAARALSR